MKNSVGIDELEKTLNRIHEWIRAADQKISIFLAFEGIIITLITLPVSSWVKGKYLLFDSIILSLLYFSFSLLTYGFIKILFALSPVLRQKQGDSFTYFGDIAKVKFESYKNRINKTTQKDYKNELLEQIHIVSKIANRKHLNFRDSLLLFCLGILFLLSSIAYFTYKYGF